MTKPFSAVLSLGGECETAFMINRFFNGIRPSSPFDWLITPIDSLIDILRDDGAKFGRTILPYAGGTSALCGQYGVLYHHEFPRRAGIIEVSEESISRCRSKLLHKFSVFKCVAEKNKTLFVRGAVATDLLDDSCQSGSILASKLNELSCSIASCIGHLDFVIVILLKNGEAHGRKYRENIIFDVYLDPKINPVYCAVGPDWPSGGDPIVFSNLFKSFDLKETDSIGSVQSADPPSF